MTITPNTTPSLKLYATGTPNGQKSSIFLELLKKEYGLQYTYRKMDFAAGEHKQPWFLELNPNGKIPTICDIDAEGNPLSIFESSAILQYLAFKYDVNNKFHYDVKDGKVFFDQVQWLSFLAASHDPALIQTAYFAMFAPEKIPAAIEHFMDITNNNFKVWEARLKANNGWLVGDKLNIVDIGLFPWINMAPKFGLDMAADYPALYEWSKKIEKIEGVSIALGFE